MKDKEANVIYTYTYGHLVTQSGKEPHGKPISHHRPDLPVAFALTKELRSG